LTGERDRVVGIPTRKSISGGASRAPVLMYHAVLATREEWTRRAPAARWYDVTADRFEQQMEFLAQTGYGTVLLEEFLSGKAPARSVVLTFDDGHESNFSVAFPVLKRCRFRAEFFVTVANVGQPGFVNWAQLSELVSAGMSVQSHGLHHQPLTGHRGSALRDEFRISKEVLERNLGAPVKYFAIPGGFANRDVYREGLAAGYEAICSSEPGLAKRSAILPRVAVTHSTSQAVFAELVSHKFLRMILMKARRQLGKAAKTLVGVQRYEALKRRALKPS